MPDNTSLIIGVVGILGGAMIGPIANDIYRKFKGSEYATKGECKAKHDQISKDCTACKTATDASICALRHDGEKNRAEAVKNRKLLLLIAIHVKVPTDELKDYM